MPKSSSANPTVAVPEYHAAAALRTIGIPYLGARLDGSRVVFVFENPLGAATRALSDHANRRLMVCSFDLAANLNYLKTDLFEARRAGGLS